MTRDLDWSAVARSADADDLREHILSGYKSGKPFTPYVPTVDLPSPIDRVLDFGCGIGRNFPYLKTIARHVAGFDLPPMIERCRAIATDDVEWLADDWSEVRRRHFDLIVATLVLQHVEPSACDAYLSDFARIAPDVYVLTRDDSDFGTCVVEALARSGAFDVRACVQVEHDAATNQLRRIGPAPFDEARRSANGSHFEILLRSRRAPAD